MPPMIISPPPTKLPKVSTTLPGSPVVRIRRVEDTFREILNSVVNSNNVGKNDISKISCTNSALNRMINAMEMLTISITSNKMLGIGIIKKITAQSRYAAIPKSAFFMVIFLLPS